LVLGLALAGLTLYVAFWLMSHRKAIWKLALKGGEQLKAGESGFVHDAKAGTTPLPKV